MENITGARKNKGEYEVQIKWSGSDDQNDKVYDPFQQIREDVSGILQHYLHTYGHRNLKRENFYIHFWLDINIYLATNNNAAMQ